MKVDVKIPSPGESILEVEIALWLVEDGDLVHKDQEIAELESEKATLPLVASESGKINILAKAETTVKVGDVVCKIDTKHKKEAEEQEGKSMDDKKTDESKSSTNKKERQKNFRNQGIKITPLAKEMMKENKLDAHNIFNGLKKITSKEVKQVLQGDISFATSNNVEPSREIEEENLSSLRKKLGERLVAVKNETAMLTTFNEVDMSRIIELRTKYQKAFQNKYGVKLGFMSFFVKASTLAFQLFPKVNSIIEKEKILIPKFVDMAIAVQTDKGLMAPVLRNTETMNFAEIESGIIELANKARNYKLSIEEMSGGTFTITNGGVFGSMLSTPIINPPQSAILGMHNIVERPVAINGKVEIRPIMYLALSYDHRLIDGKESVSFLVKIKEFIESPENMLVKNNLEKQLFQL